MRVLARGLHPAILNYSGLTPALDAVAERLPITVDIRVPPLRWPSETELTAYFVVCEALTNVAKHSGVDSATVVIKQLPNCVIVTIRDSGAGGAQFTNHGGQTGLRDRVDAVGGHLDLVSTIGTGTEITARLPGKALS